MYGTKGDSASALAKNMCERSDLCRSVQSVCAPRAQHREFLDNMHHHMITEHHGTLGGLIHLSSVMRNCHLIHAMGLDEHFKPISTPRLPIPTSANNTPLDNASRSLNRPSTMRYACMALGRPASQSSSKQLARQMQQPTRHEHAETCVQTLSVLADLFSGSRHRKFPAQVVVCAGLTPCWVCETTEVKQLFVGVLWRTHDTQHSNDASSDIAEFRRVTILRSSEISQHRNWFCQHCSDMSLQLQKSVEIMIDATAGIGVVNR